MHSCDHPGQAGGRFCRPSCRLTLSAPCSIFERAIAVCGSDPKAVGIWSAWLDYESKQVDGMPGRVLARQVGCGSPAAEIAISKLRDMAANRPAGELLLQAEESEVYSAADSAIAANPGVDRDSVVREMGMGKRGEDAAASAALASARSSYEAGIGKRIWFHVLPLQAAALSGWRSYLDFEESSALEAVTGGSPQAVAAAWARVEKLYARCLVACAAYAEFWLRYAAFRREYPDAARAAGPCVAVAGSPSDILLHAHTHFCPARTDVLTALTDALIEEGKKELAMQVFERAREGSPHPLLGREHVLPVPGWAKESVEVTIRQAHAVLRLMGPAGIARASEVLRAAIAHATGTSASAVTLVPLYAELGRVFSFAGDSNRAEQAWQEGAQPCGSVLAYWQAWAAAAQAGGLSTTPASVYALALGLDESGRPAAGQTVGGSLKEADVAVAWALYMEALRTGKSVQPAVITVAADEHARWARKAALGGLSAGQAAATAMAGRKRPLEEGGERPAAAKVANTTA